MVQLKNFSALSKSAYLTMRTQIYPLLFIDIKDLKTSMITVVEFKTKQATGSSPAWAFKKNFFWIRCFKINNNNSIFLNEKKIRWI